MHLECGNTCSGRKLSMFKKVVIATGRRLAVRQFVLHENHFCWIEFREFNRQLSRSHSLMVSATWEEITLAESLHGCGRRDVPLLNYTLTFAVQLKRRNTPRATKELEENRWTEFAGFQGDPRLACWASVRHNYSWWSSVSLGWHRCLSGCWNKGFTAKSNFQSTVTANADSVTRSLVEQFLFPIIQSWEGHTANITHWEHLDPQPAAPKQVGHWTPESSLLPLPRYPLLQWKHTVTALLSVASLLLQHMWIKAFPPGSGATEPWFMRYMHKCLKRTGQNSARNFVA